MENYKSKHKPLVEVVEGMREGGDRLKGAQENLLKLCQNFLS